MTAPTTETPQPPPAPRAGWARPRDRLTLRAAIPLVLLLLALSTEFLLGDERGHTYRGSVHNGVTANHMAVARNLSPKHGFLGIYSFTLDDDGDLAYRPYNRFPIGGYLLLKLAMSPFGDDFSSEILAARTLMRAFFVLSAVSAYLALCRIVASRWVALAATLTAFSSFHLLYYNDMVATESMPSLFGVLLAFHGMVVFVQEGRFRQLLVKACAALLLGWHVYALLIAFIVLGLARELVGALPLFPRFGRSDQACGGGGGGLRRRPAAAWPWEPSPCCSARRSCRSTWATSTSRSAEGFRWPSCLRQGPWPIAWERTKFVMQSTPNKRLGCAIWTMGTEPDDRCFPRGGGRENGNGCPFWKSSSNA